MHKKYPFLISLLLILPTPTYPKKKDQVPVQPLSPAQAQTVAAFIAIGACATATIFSKYLRRKSPRVHTALKLIALLGGAYALAATITQYIPIYCSPNTNPSATQRKKRRPFSRRRKRWGDRFG